jgi:hypothetical protein
VQQHRYRQEIEDLLAAGWTPRNLNAFMRRQHADYEPVADRTLRRYRDRFIAGRVRQVAKYEKMLDDEHVLLDTIRMKAGVLLFQQLRLDRAIEMEEKLGGMVLDQVGKEAERLVRMAESYEQSLQMLGVLPRDPGTLGPAVNVTQQNLVVAISQQLDEQIDRLIERIPPELRPQLGRQLEAERTAEAEERIKALEAEVRARAPAPIDLDEPP